MADPAPENDVPGLGTYEGHDVVTATVSIRNTGHGLEEAMQVDPVKLDLASTHYVVLECEVEKHRYDPIKESTGLELVNMLKAGRATIVDYDLVAGALDAQTARIEQAKADAEHDDRQLRLGDDPDEDLPIDESDPALAVVADPVTVLEEAEDTGEWRRRRTAELDRMAKDDVEGIARDLGVSTTGRPTKSELVDRVLDEEETRRG